MSELELELSTKKRHEQAISCSENEMVPRRRFELLNSCENGCLIRIESTDLESVAVLRCPALGAEHDRLATSAFLARASSNVYIVISVTQEFWYRISHIPTWQLEKPRPMEKPKYSFAGLHLRSDSE